MKAPEKRAFFLLADNVDEVRKRDRWLQPSFFRAFDNTIQAPRTGHDALQADQEVRPVKARNLARECAICPRDDVDQMYVVLIIRETS